LVGFKIFWDFLADFPKNPQKSDFKRTLQEGAALTYGERRTGGLTDMAKLTSAHRKPAKSAKK